MNNLLQSLRGVLSALIGFQSPEDGLLEKARRRWNEGRATGLPCSTKHGKSA